MYKHYISSELGMHGIGTQGKGHTLPWCVGDMVWWSILLLLLTFLESQWQWSGRELEGYNQISGLGNGNQSSTHSRFQN